MAISIEKYFSKNNTLDIAQWLKVVTLKSASPKSTTGLAGGTYYCRSRDTDGTNYGEWRPEKTVIVAAPKLATPTLNAPTVVSSSQIDISWLDVANEGSYQILYSTDNITFTAHGTVGADITSYSVTGLTGGTLYYTRVIAVTANSALYLNSDPATTSATTSNLTALATPVLNAPTVVSSSQLDVSWTDILNESSYRLEVSPDNITFSLLASPAANIVSFSHTGLTASTAYYYRLKAIGDGVTYADSAWSAVVSATTSASTALPKLTTPGPLTTSSIRQKQIDLAFTNVVNETEYEIQRSADGITGAFLATAAIHSTSYSDATVEAASTTYYYRVRAIGDGVNYSNSDFTPWVAGTTIPENFYHGFAGTVLDTAVLQIDDPLDDVSIAQNEALLFNITGSGNLIASTLTNKVTVKTYNICDDGIFQFTVPATNNDAKSIFAISLHNQDNTDQIILQKITSGSTNAQFRLFTASTKRYEIDTGIIIYGQTFRFIKTATNDIKLEYLNAGVWTQIGVTQNFVTSRDLKIRIGCNKETVDSTNAAHSVDELYATKTPYTTATPF